MSAFVQDNMTLLLWAIPLLPLLGAALNGAVHSRTIRARIKDPEAQPCETCVGWLGTLAVAIPFLIAVLLFFALREAAADGLAKDGFLATLGTWIHAGPLALDWTLRFDQLTACMVMVVTGVGSLIHIYSAGYMHGDPGFAKFFAYLNLFIAMMLMLVMSESLIGLFLGWEGVGLCSYLLIGFWYDDGLKADAGVKAFVVNRIGDLGFLVGMFLLFWYGEHTLSTRAINGMFSGHEAHFPAGIATAAAILLFVGACGKSAQIPLFVWLPDAMAGPTPVSALIHAATMVTAGVYMLARLSPLYAFADGALAVVAVVGAATALMAATIGLAQRDIKKVLAYSTVSQLGYMFLAMGVGAFTAGIFHLITHAFFKALLFLGAGSVIHAMHEEQDIFKMGGLSTRIKLTYGTFLVGALALAGIPGFSGFFSKDEILFEAATGPHMTWVLWGVGSLGALLTALYTGRLLALTFFGKPRFDEKEVHVHESPRSMTSVLSVLAFLSIAGGLLGIPFVMHPLADWLAPVVGEASHHVRGSHGDHSGLEIGLLFAGSAIAIGGVLAGLLFFRCGDLTRAEKLQRNSPGLHRFLAGAWFVDALYATVVVKPLRLCARISGLFDLAVVDGAVNAVGRGARGIGRGLRSTQDGRIGSYSLWFAIGAAVLLITFLRLAA